MERFWEPMQIILDRVTSSEVEIGIDRSELIGLIRGLNIRGILLGRPGSFVVIHLFVIFGPKWSRGDKGVSDEFISILESKAFLIEVVYPFLKFFK
jgi:hypothetical protein